MSRSTHQEPGSRALADEAAFVEAWKQFATWASHGTRRRPATPRTRPLRGGALSSASATGRARARFAAGRARRSSRSGWRRSSSTSASSSRPSSGSSRRPTNDESRNTGDGSLREGRRSDFDAPVERVFQYMRAGNHPHQAFKSHRLVGDRRERRTLAVEAYNPDGSTTEMTVEHQLDPPSGIVTTMAGGHSRRPVRPLLHTARRSHQGRSRGRLPGAIRDVGGRRARDDRRVLRERLRRGCGDAPHLVFGRSRVSASGVALRAIPQRHPAVDLPSAPVRRRGRARSAPSDWLDRED